MELTKRWMKQGWLWMLLAVVLTGLPAALVAQQPNAAMVSAERGAMQKLAFLAGKWSGPVMIYRGPGKPLELTQHEVVRYKLNGLVMLIEGKSTDAAGRAHFSALATIAYDPARQGYRIRAYSGGRYLDARLRVVRDGFSWGFAEGPAHILNRMHLTGKGKWLETTEVTVGSNPPRRSMRMLLEHNR